VPKDTPFLETMKFVEHDNSVDPFDALEMTNRAASAVPQGRAAGSTGAPSNNPK
jgi:hypothetical protein